MKYAMLPTPWEETLQALDAAGHELSLIHI